MNTLLKAIVVALPVMLLAACSRQEAASDTASAGNADEAQSETQSVFDTDESSDQESSGGELAMPADEADFPERSDDALIAAENAAELAALDSTPSPLVDSASETPAAVAAQATPIANAESPTAKATIATPPRPSMDESKILAEKHGQWASTAKASSTYASDPGAKAPYSAWQATGAPNVPTHSDHPASWASKSGDSSTAEWLEVGFAKAVRGTSIRVRQSAAPGVISKIELIDESGATHVVWEGTDTTSYEKNTIGWFVADFPQTAYKVKGARITLVTSRVWGWNEIDAVQLVGEA